jgi:hypothetical protein
MSGRPFRRGLEDLGNGLYAWMQPDGSWGWSNAGFVRDGDESLLIDTLFDEPLTAEMLAAIEDATAYRTETERRDALNNYLHYYNHHRPHTAINNQPPTTRVNNLPDQHR